MITITLRKGWRILYKYEGLKYLHEMNVLHTDLKPTNILVTGGNETITIKLADFNEV